VTGAGDCRIRVHDVGLCETTHVCSCHTGRVKRLATAPNVPYMFWSAAEDGTVMWVKLSNYCIYPHARWCHATKENVVVRVFVVHDLIFVLLLEALKGALWQT